MIYLTGFADEAANDIDRQIAAIEKLGWSHIELRSVNGQNITDVSDADYVWLGEGDGDLISASVATIRPSSSSPPSAASLTVTEQAHTDNFV